MHVGAVRARGGGAPPTHAACCGTKPAPAQSSLMAHAKQFTSLMCCTWSPRLNGHLFCFDLASGTCSSFQHTDGGTDGMGRTSRASGCRCTRAPSSGSPTACMTWRCSPHGARAHSGLGHRPTHRARSLAASSAAAIVLPSTRGASGPISPRSSARSTPGRAARARPHVGPGSEGGRRLAG